MMFEPPSNELPKNYLANGYFDEKGYLRREVIVEHAEEIAKSLSKSHLMSSTSLRKFYTNVSGIFRKYKILHDFDAVRPQVDMLIPFVAKEVNRKTVPKLFEKFIIANVKLARQSGNDLSAFYKHFQYVVSFAKFEDDERNQGGQQRGSHQPFNKFNNKTRRN